VRFEIQVEKIPKDIELECKKKKKKPYELNKKFQEA
jgi:hypothetical protein